MKSSWWMFATLASWMLYGSADSLVDTDGDGMPDLWEEWNDGITDPLVADGNESDVSDVMAYAQVTGTLLTVWQYGDVSSKETYILSDGAAIPQVGDPAQGLALNSKYAYGDVCGMGLPTNAPAGSVVYAIEKNVSIALVHAQVYRKFGFNSLTANPAVADDLRINTKPFTALDKYLMVRYFSVMGLADECEVMRMGLWPSVSLMPCDGDNDKDGLPDGWELYTMFGNADIPQTISACRISPFNYSDARSASPGNSAKTVLEVYNQGNPTDPWGIDVPTDDPATNVVNQTSVCLTVTNVVLHYVILSHQTDVVAPATTETGFVNVITEVKGGTVAIPECWSTNYPKFVEKYGNDFTAALMKKTQKRDGSGNEMLVWQDYVAGTDPTDESSKFQASITVDANGKVIISYTPEFTDAKEAARRKYTTYGKVKLQDSDWVEVAAGHEGDYNFFKVTVEMVVK